MKKSIISIKLSIRYIAIICSIVMLGSLSTYGQVAGTPASVNMANTTTTVATGTFVNFYDNGGSAGNYTDGVNLTHTFASANGLPLVITFTAFQTRNANDYLRIYDGASVATGRLLGTYSGGTSPGTIRPDSSSVTFVFVSDGANNRFGWDATITSMVVDNAITATCTGTFLDNGGAGNYTANKYYNVAYQSDNGKTLKVDFTAFNLATGDVLKIYKGDVVNGLTLIGSYSNASPGAVYSSIGGVLTFVFSSNNDATVGTGWSANISCIDVTTYYSYTSGNWNDPLTWTLDASGTVYNNPTAGYPGKGGSALDQAVVINGDVVTVTNNNNTISQLEIQAGATLNVAGTNGQSYGTILGQGRLRSTTGDLPTGNYTQYTSSDGGTIELYGNITGSPDLSWNTFNNLEIKGNTNQSVYTQYNTQINGDLLIESGNFYINHNGTVDLTTTVEGNIIVSPGAIFSLGGGNAQHTLYVKGDFENEGTVTFTNATIPGSYTSNPAESVTLVFNNTTKNQNFACNGPTVLHNLYVNKGTDDTYMLDLNANTSANFSLRGRNDGLVANTNDPGNVVNNKALEVFAGTLRLGSNITIPRLLTDGDYYAIDQDATIIVDGASIGVTEQANTSSIVTYGKLKVMGSSTFSSMGRQGIILREYGIFEVTGGTINTTAFRTSSRLELGTHRGTFIMSGGTLNINGDNYANSHPAFALPFGDNTFQMTGGIINITNSTYATDNGGGGNYFSWLVSSNPQNISVTGGDVNIYATTRRAYINSAAPFYNLNLYGSAGNNISIEGIAAQVDGGNTVVPATAQRELVVLNNLSIGATTNFVANDQNVTVAKDFSLNASGTYTPGNNTTIFNGYGAQLFTNSGSITTGLNNMTLTNAAKVEISKDITVRGGLIIGSGTTLYDMGKTITANADITNSGTHESQPGGSLVLAGTTDQTIYGDGTGIFGNLSLNKTAGVTTLNANVSVIGNLRLANTNALFNIGSNELSLTATSGIYDNLTNPTTTGFSATRMIQTAGAQSDKGIIKAFASTGEVVLPLGSAGKYTPAKIEIISAPTAWGTISVNPVNSVHPLSTSSNALKYYWNVKHVDMEGIPAGDLKMKFYYAQADIVGTEAIYVPSYYYPISWTSFTADKVADATNEILFDNIVHAHGQFTAGETGSFGAVQTYYSRQTGNWSDLSGINYTSWTTDTGTNAPATSLPGVNSPVVIRSGHTITVPVPENNKLVGSMHLEPNSVIDLTTTTGHFFGIIQESTVSGTGTIRISSATPTAEFPGGDFGEFLGTNGGTVEYYTTGGQDFTMPAGGKTTNILINESFDGATFPPVGWIRHNVDGGGTQWVRNTAQAHSGSGSAFHDYTTPYQTGLLVTPALNFSENGSYEISFWRYNTYPTFYVKQALLISTTNNSPGSFTEVQQLGQGASAWQKITVDLSAYAGNATVYVAIAYEGYDADGFFVDDVTVTKSSGNSTYHHLMVNPAASRTITFPDINVNASGNLTVKGAGITATTSSASTAITITGNTSIEETGTFRFENSRVQSFNAKGNLTIANGASMVVNTNGTGPVNHKLNLYGDVANNGTLNLNPGSGRYADLYFLGTGNRTFSGTGATASFYRVYVNKGTSQAPMINVTSSKFDLNATLAQSLFITNGTIRFSGGSLTPSLTSTGSFIIPQTGCLSVNGSTVTIGSSATDAADLYLSGKLEIIAGTMNIGAAANNTHNDIEYATAGTPEVVVGGTGRLNVNGQIRRSTTIATGNLTYNQSGGDVYIYGKNRDANQIKRALLEVLNAGSRFVSSGGNLYLAQGVTAPEAANTFGELYLNAETHSVTGGTIITGTTTTAAATNNFNLYLANPVWNLTVDGTTTAKNAVIKTFAPTINNNLTINGPAASMFHTGGYTVSIGGNLENYSGATTSPGGYNYKNASQTTRFFGVSQAQRVISSGTIMTRMAVVEIDNQQPNGSVAFTGSLYFRLYGDLKILNGKCITENQYIQLLVNVVNNSIHESIGASGYLNFYSGSNQYISGSNDAAFGKFTLAANKTVISSISFRVNTNITLGANSKLSIGDKLLTLGPTTTVTGVTPTAYILTNGALSDQGVRREYSAAGNFTFPVGVPTEGGKYTPATINVTNTGGAAGTITVKPVDAPHPMRTNTLNDELAYFWSVSSTGFGATPTVNHTYSYLDADIVGSEATYVNARLYDFTWTKQTEVVDFANNQIKFTGVNYVDGDYTCGEVSNWGTVHKYYSRSNGNWTNAGSWWIDSPTGPTVAATAPNGNPVFIQAGHTITTNLDGAYAGSCDIAATATLDLGTKTMHNLGVISGGGTIHIDATGAGSFVFPGGDPTSFMNTTGSTVHYSGAGTIPASITTYQNVTFSGNGNKTIPAIDFLVKGNLSILGGNLNNDDNDRTITLQGNWISTVSGGYISGTGKVSLTGGNAQTISATGGESFYNFEANKTAGSTVTLNSPSKINRAFTLTSGVVNTTSTNLLTMEWDDANALTGGNINAYVDGPLCKLVRNSSTFRFPMGDATRYGSIYISGTQSTGNQYWTAEYFNAAPANQSNLAAPLQLVSNNEYWTLTGVAATKANVQLRWDNLSQIIPATALGRQKLRVAEYLSSKWTKVGETVVDGGVNSGTVASSTPITASGSADLFTLGIEQTASAQITGTDASVCNNGTTIPISLTLSGDTPLTVDVAVNGVFNRTITANSTSYTINLTYAELYAISGAGVYTITLQHVYDKNGIEGVVLASQAAITLLATPNPIISGPNSVMTNSTTSYSGGTAGNTFNWTISPGLGTISGSTTSNPSITWGAAAGIATLQLTETNTTSGCSKVTTYLVSVRDWPVIVGDFNVCANSTETYSSKQVAGHSYTWSIVGGTVQSGAGTYQITVLWGTEASGSIELTQGSAGDGYNTITELITVSVSPTATITADNSGVVCQNEQATLRLSRSGAGAVYSYFLTLPDASVITLDQLAAPANPHVYTSANLPWVGPAVNTPYIYKLRVVNNTSGCSSAEVQTTVNVYVTPQTGPQYHVPNNF